MAPMMPVDRKAAMLATVCLAALMVLAVLFILWPYKAFVILAIITLLADLISVWALIYIGVRR
jgi:hypothetical protein